MIYLIFMFVFTSLTTIHICWDLHKKSPFIFLFLVLSFIFCWLGFVVHCDIIEVVKVGG